MHFFFRFLKIADEVLSRIIIIKEENENNRSSFFFTESRKAPNIILIIYVIKKYNVCYIRIIVYDNKLR